MTRQRKRIVKSTAMLVMVLAIASCKKSCEVVEKTSPTPGPVQLVGSGDTYVEITAAASAPLGGSGPCKDGMILVTGGNGTQQLLMGGIQAPLPASYDLAGWDAGSKSWAKRGTGPLDPPPTGASEEPAGSDNQTARLANGDLLLMWNGTTKASLSNSASLPWWDNWGPKPADLPQFANGVWPPNFARAGWRAAQVIWRYSCAQGKWLSTTMLDGGLAQALPIPPVKNAEGRSKPAEPEAGRCVQSPPWVRGFDRPELYVDPWGVNEKDNSLQRIFVSTRCSRFDDDSTQVFTSWDSGATWNPSGIRLDPSTPVAMTTTKTRLFLFQSVNFKPVLHWSENNGVSLATPDGGYDITYVTPEASPDPSNKAQKKFGAEWLGSEQTGVGHAQAPTLSVVRAGPNAVLAVYPAIEKVNVGTADEFQRQVAAAVCVIPKGSGEEPILIPIKIFRAQAERGSVLMPTVIEDDRTEVTTRTSLLYWIETAGPPANAGDPVQLFAKYVTFNGPVPSAEKFLSDPAGWKSKNTTKYKAMGDYIKGGYYFHNGTMNFVAVWPQVLPSDTSLQNSQVFMRVISLAEAPASPEVQLEKMPGAKPAPKAKWTTGLEQSPTPQGKP